jgi:hypothetical protein
MNLTTAALHALHTDNAVVLGKTGRTFIRGKAVRQYDGFFRQRNAVELFPVVIIDGFRKVEAYPDSVKNPTETKQHKRQKQFQLAGQISHHFLDETLMKSSKPDTPTLRSSNLYRPVHVKKTIESKRKTSESQADGNLLISERKAQSNFFSFGTIGKTISVL